VRGENKMDALDKKILKLLDKNARMENADIATVLDTTEENIEKRIKR
jgi:DNA-binding Lrp family transcriptional regulator